MTGRSALRLVLLLALGLPGVAAAQEDVAVIVHPQLAVEDLKFTELRKILRGDRQFWPSGETVTLLVHPPAAYERQVLLSEVYEMSESQFKQHWIAKVFRAETTSGPKVVLSNQMASQLVGAIPGAVALVSVEEVPEGVKILKVDGKLPGETGYPLR